MLKRLAAVAGLVAVLFLLQADRSAASCQPPTLVRAGPPPADPPPGALRVVTLNLAEETDAARILARIEATPALAQAHVFLFQEVLHGPQTALLDSLAKSLSAQAAFASTSSPGADASQLGIAILSRVPLANVQAIPLERFSLNIRSRCRVALAADAADLRVVNVHLDTRINAPTRLRQLEPALAAADAHPGPAVIAGDFNSTTLFWLEHLVPIPLVHDQADALLAHMESRGYQAPHRDGPSTLPILGLKLDWVFLRGARATDWAVLPMEFSDHRAVSVALAPTADVR